MMALQDHWSAPAMFLINVKYSDIKYPCEQTVTWFAVSNSNTYHVHVITQTYSTYIRTTYSIWGCKLANALYFYLTRDFNNELIIRNIAGFDCVNHGSNKPESNEEKLRDISFWTFSCLVVEHSFPFTHVFPLDHYSSSIHITLAEIDAFPFTQHLCHYNRHKWMRTRIRFADD